MLFRFWKDVGINQERPGHWNWKFWINLGTFWAVRAGEHKKKGKSPSVYWVVKINDSFAYLLSDFGRRIGEDCAEAEWNCVAGRKRLVGRIFDFHALNCSLFNVRYSISRVTGCYHFGTKWRQLISLGCLMCIRFIKILIPLPAKANRE